MDQQVQFATGPVSQVIPRRRCFVISPIGPYGSEIRNHMDTVFHCIIEPVGSVLIR